MLSQEIPGGASNARATICDTNMPTAGQLPLRHQHVIFSVQAIFDEANTDSSAHGLVNVQAHGGYQENLVADGIRKWNEITSNLYFALTVEGTKPYVEGYLCRFPSGGGLWFEKSEEPGTVTHGSYYVCNGVPGAHAGRRLAMPIHLGALEQFQGMIRFPRGQLGNWTDGVAGSKGDYGITIVLNGPRQRPIG